MDATAVQLTSPCPGTIAVILLTGTDASQVLHAADTPLGTTGSLAPGQVTALEV